MSPPTTDPNAPKSVIRSKFNLQKHTFLHQNQLKHQILAFEKAQNMDLEAFGSVVGGHN